MMCKTVFPILLLPDECEGLFKTTVEVTTILKEGTPTDGKVKVY